MTIAYLANSFPEPLESYVWEEITELRRRGVAVVPCSVRHPRAAALQCSIPRRQVEYLLPVRPLAFLRANWLLLRRFSVLRNLIGRALSGPEHFQRRLRTLAHTWLGAYLAARLAGRKVRHIHVHHAYFSSWIGMIAARILGAGFSMTLHGSDLLVRRDYLDTKFATCDFCFTVSEFNRRYILERYALVPEKVLVRRLGVDPAGWRPTSNRLQPGMFAILSVGRLHPVKNHAFLLLACYQLKTSGVRFRCQIVGEGPERSKLEELIARLELQPEVTLLGHVAREQLPPHYAAADAVVLTSHCEGIPVTLMEAMAMERMVIAPRITGIPELIADGVNGLLYTQGSVAQFVSKLNAVRQQSATLDAIRRAARVQIERSFNGQINLQRFASDFVTRVGSTAIRVGAQVQEPAFIEQLKAAG